MSDLLSRAIATGAAVLVGLWIMTSGLGAAAANDACRPLSQGDTDSLQGRKAIVADIDGVLSQYFLQDYGPTNGAFLDMGIAYSRKDAALMMNIYHRRGYVVVYLAGRPRQIEVQGQTMCEATLDWLETNGFPIERGDTLLLLRDGSKAITDAKNRGRSMAEWMGVHGTQLFASMVDNVKQSLGLQPQYGYVDSDVVADAFIQVGVPAGNIFTIGNKGVSRLGYRGTHAIVGPGANPGYTKHIREFVVPKVEPVE